jgi:hypothetical protein
MTRFKSYSAEQWAVIKDIVKDYLGEDADQIVLSRQVSVAAPNLPLRLTLELAVAFHHTMMRLQLKPNDLHEDMTTMREDAELLRARLGILGFSKIIDFAPDSDMVEATDAYFDKLMRNLDGAIAAITPFASSINLPPPASKPERDRFWKELLAIWCEIGGKETGAAAADFLIGASVMPVQHTAVVEWLRLRRAKRQNILN